MFNLFTSDIASSFDSSATSEGGENLLSSIDWNVVINSIFNWIVTKGLRLIIGLIVLFIGCKLINRFANRVRKRMTAKNKEKTLVSVVYQILKYGLKIGLLFLIVTFVGFDTAGIGVIISSLGVGVSLAVQGSLSNFAGGLVILVMKPFKIGDYITAQGCSGTVEEIKMFYTYLVTPDNKVQMIPNGVLANDVIVNVSVKEDRRVDLEFSVAYGEDTTKVKEIIKSVISTNSDVFTTPEPFVKVGDYLDSAINFKVRVWTKNSKYWDVYFDLNDRINQALVDAGIEIPYNKLDVHLKND